jgi:hypothetical protein
MSVRHRLLLATAVLVVVTAGSWSSAAGPPSVVHADGPVHVQDGTFQMEGVVTIGAAGESLAYHDVRVVLYDENRTVLTVVELGTLSTDPRVGPRSRPLNVTSDVVPAYVHVESRSFWRHGDVRVEGFVAREVARPGGPEVQYDSYVRAGPGERFPDAG